MNMNGKKKHEYTIYTITCNCLDKQRLKQYISLQYMNYIIITSD